MNVRHTLFLLCAALLFAGTAHASDATIFLSPVTGTYTLGEPVIVRVLVGTGGDSVNAVEGKLLYDPKAIEVVEVDISRSFLTSWTRPPVFNNDTGEIIFGGGMSGTSSFSGERGEVVALTLRGLRAVETHLRFDSGSASQVHAADGTGGNLLSALTSGVYAFTPIENNVVMENTDVGTTTASSTEESAIPIEGEVLGAATGTILTSSTHPDQDHWYNGTSSTIEWEGVPDVANYLLSFNKKPSSEGIVLYAPSVHQKTINNIEDGIWYFHLTRRFSDGQSDYAHYRLQVDTEPPSVFLVSEKSREHASDPNVVISVVATDTLSGIDHYEFSVNQKDALVWTDDGTHEYHLPVLPPGVHDLLANVFDKAGNITSHRLQFSIEYLATPAITLINTQFSEDDDLHLNIHATPNARVNISIARGDETPVVEEFVLDASGQGAFVSAHKFVPGIYRVWGSASDAKGATSLASEHLSLSVEASFMGLIRRHPLVPIVGISSLFFIVFACIFWKKIHTNEEEIPLDDVSAQREVVREQPRHMQGAVILGKRELVRPPATRL